MTAQSKNNSQPLSWLWPLGLLILVIVIWTCMGWFASAQQDPGQFGDMFGAVNALFSGLAFAGVIYAILLQRHELSLQRTELELTRAELAGQKEQLKAQNETFKSQNFESTFFQLLRLHNDIVNATAMRDVNAQVVAEGRDCFRGIYEQLKVRWNKVLEDDAGPTELERINKTYLAFYARFEAQLGHYFRSLYNIIKFVDQGATHNARLYTNLVRAQLSTFEVALLFYNCLSDMGSHKFKPLVGKYTLLKMVPKSELINSAHIELYEEQAYKVPISD